MQVIPVIDLMAGRVVRGEGGRRDRYRPVVSELCGSSLPRLVAPILCDYAASDTLYIADLDALTGGAIQIAVLSELLDALPRVGIWLDAGFRHPRDLAAILAHLGPGAAARVTPVFASEALPDPRTARACMADRRNTILSLDRRGEQRLDPAGCWDAPDRWPERVIVMTLERVGSYDGPDLDMLRTIGRIASPPRLIGAGGVRNEDDLTRAAAAGAHAWLVASALHDRALERRAG